MSEWLMVETTAGAKLWLRVAAIESIQACGEGAVIGMATDERHEVSASADKLLQAITETTRFGVPRR